MTERKSKRIKWIIVLSIWVYIIFRASLLSLTHDEAFSFFLVKTNYFNALVGTANTHWLNSLTMKLGSLISYEPIFLRWGSVASWLLYGYSAIQLSGFIKNKTVSALICSALLLNPFVIDFFCLARGYGMMCAFVLAAVQAASFPLARGQWELSSLRPAFFWSILAVCANYTALYFLMSFTGIVVIYLITTHRFYYFLRWDQWKKTWLPVVGTIVFAAANLLFIKLYTGDLEYGGSNFARSIFGSLVEGTMYHRFATTHLPLLTYGFVLAISLCILFAVYLFAKRKVWSPAIFIASLILGILLLNVLFHYLFGTPYLQSRTSLVLYPLFVGLICFAIDELHIAPQVIKQATGILGVAAIGLHFINTINLTHCYEWKFQADTARCLQRLAKERPNNVLMHDWHTGILVNYFKETEPVKYNFLFTRLSTERMLAPDAALLQQLNQYDYAVLAEPVNLSIYSGKEVRFELIEHFPVAGVMVFKVNRK